MGDFKHTFNHDILNFTLHMGLRDLLLIPAVCIHVIGIIRWW